MSSSSASSGFLELKWKHNWTHFFFCVHNTNSLLHRLNSLQMNQELWELLFNVFSFTLFGSNLRKLLNYRMFALWMVLKFRFCFSFQVWLVTHTFAHAHTHSHTTSSSAKSRSIWPAAQETCWMTEPSWWRRCCWWIVHTPASRDADTLESHRVYSVRAVGYFIVWRGVHFFHLPFAYCKLNIITLWVVGPLLTHCRCNENRFKV